MDNIKKTQAKIRKEFSYLNKVKNIGLAYTSAQAKEICEYLNRIELIPFPAWKAFLLGNINYDKDQFLYTFYLLENEFGVLEPDVDRIDKII